LAGGPGQKGNGSSNKTTCAPAQDDPCGCPRQGGTCTGRPAKGKLGELVRGLKSHRFGVGGTLLKVTQLAEDGFEGVTLDGDPVTVKVDDDTVYHNLLNPDASFSDIKVGTIVRVRGPRDEDTMYGRVVVIVPVDKHRVVTRGTVSGVSNGVLTVERPNGRTVEYTFTPDVVKFMDETQEAIELGDKVWAIGWKADFSSEPATATKIVDFGPSKNLEPAAP